MTEVEEIGEGVFLVSWTSKNPSYSEEPFAANANVIIYEVSQACRLSFNSIGQFNESTLGIEIDPIPSGKNGKNLQTLRPASVVAIKDGNKQSMELQYSIWTARFPGYCDCGNIPAVSKFVILIDFNSTPKKTKLVMNNLLNLWETKTLADVTFKFKEKEIKAHSSIIASGSPLLATMFQNDFKEKQERIVVITDAKSTVFEKMLRFFYTGDTGLDNIDVAELLILAIKYRVDSLKEECFRFMAENLTVSNVIPCLILSQHHKCPNLHRCTLEFISRNSLAIVSRNEWAYLMKNHHELGLTAVEKMFFSLNNIIETQK